MRTLILAAVFMWTLSGSSSFGQLVDGPSICNYPRRDAVEPKKSLRPDAVIRDDEKEENNTPDKAQLLPLGFGADEDQDVDINGKVEEGFDVDFYKIRATAGDILGIACLVSNTRLGLDPSIEIQSNGKLLISNDNHEGFGDLYPATSPLPVCGDRRDAIIPLTVPTTGEYLIKIRSYGASTGEYRLQLRLRKPGVSAELKDHKQTVFLDFDGAQIKNGQRTFGRGARDTIDFSKMSKFLPQWGLTDADEPALIDATVKTFKDLIDDLRTSAGGGAPAFDVSILNSKDDADHFADDPMVSRVIIGGTVKELGIKTIGLAQCIDPGNFSTNDTAVVLLDLLSAAPGDPNSIRSLRVSRPGAKGANEVVPFSDLSKEMKIGLVARIVAAVALHEFGHCLGCYHCLNDNNVASIMDQGGNLGNVAGVGPDGILGTSDDRPTKLVGDVFAPEGFSTELTQPIEAIFIASLSLGTRTPRERLAELEAQLLRIKLVDKQLQASTSVKSANVVKLGPDSWTYSDIGKKIVASVKPTEDIEEITISDITPRTQDIPIIKLGPDALKDPRLRELSEILGAGIKRTRKQPM